MYIYCVACYRVLVIRCVRSIGDVSTHLYTYVDDSEHPWTMSYLYYAMSCSFLSGYITKSKIVV